MNQRPSGYEPDELPGCSTPHQQCGRYAPGPRAVKWLLGAPEKAHPRLALGAAGRIVCGTLTTGILWPSHRDRLFYVGRFALTRLRLGVLLALAVAFGAFSHAPEAMAAAEVHHLNLVISGNPSQVDGGGMNELINRYNQYPLAARGKNGLEKIGMGWFFDAELRYFVRPNFALAAGVGQLKIQTKQGFSINSAIAIDVRGEVISVPVRS